MYSFKEGFIDALVRGQKAELLTSDDYSKIRQCDTLADFKLFLATRGYYFELHNEADVLDPTTLVAACTLKFVKSFRQLVSLASEPLTSILNFISYSYMIDNVILIMAGAIHGRSFAELSENCHPIGIFDSIRNLMVANDLHEIHRLVLIDTPISGYFSGCLGQHTLDETRLEYVRNSVHKAYLEDFVRKCSELKEGSDMMDLLHFEADRRVINIAISSLDTEMSASDKLKLFPECGGLFPVGQADLAKCSSLDEIRMVIRNCASHGQLSRRLMTADLSSLDKSLYEIESELCHHTFECETGHALFFAYNKLCEQELRNIMWVAECLVQQQRSRIEEGLIYAGSTTKVTD